MSKDTKNGTDQEQVQEQEEVTVEVKVDSGSETSEQEGSGDADLAAELAASQRQTAELQDKYRRLYADFDNFRKRTNRERLDLIQNASKDVLTNLLPILDDMERAMKASDGSGDGFKLIYNKFKSTLDQFGLKVMEAQGEAFDADLHEAITEIPAPNKSMKGKVVDVIERGYYLNDKILRYAKVVVGK